MFSPFPGRPQPRPPAASPSKDLCTRPASGASPTSVRSPQYKAGGDSFGQEEGGSGPQPTDRRRWQCRANQQRYRDKQKFIVLQLEARVMHLRQAAKYHQIARDALVTGKDVVAKTVTEIASEFFSMFRFGLSGASLTLPIRPHTFQVVPTSQATHSERETVTLLAPSNASDAIIRSVLPQLVFLQTVFSSDVGFGGLNGIDAFVEQLWRYSCYFSSFRLEMERIQLQPRVDEASMHDSAFVSATCQLTLMVTQATLAHVFLNAEGNEWMQSSLLGKKLDCACEISFEFERRGDQYQVTRMDMKLDLLAALRAVLGRMDAVAAVLDCALVSPDGLIGDLRSHPSGCSYDSNRDASE